MPTASCSSWRSRTALRFRTEFGVIDIEPGEVCVIPRGVIFRVELIDGPARAYVCENYGGGFTLPDRGPIGANCLANPRDFLTPVAAYEDIEAPHTLIVKWGGELYRTEVAHSPIDVVAWHGNYYPYKYDLRRFSPVGAIAFDHPDPSIFTVMTSPSETPGTANIDFVIFPERWAVAENTFRPPWYHRNIMSEFMGLVYGVYDAKPEGFVPGGMSLHNQMLPHGPDADAFNHASNVELKPVKLTNTLAFMFETRFRQRVTKYAAELDTRQDDYADCWSGLAQALQSEQARAGLMKLASLKHGRDGRLVVVSRDLARCADASACRADLAGGARRLGRRRAAPHRDRGCARSRAHRARAVRPGEVRRAAAALARLGRRVGLREPCGAGAPRARRRAAGLVLDRSADVSRRLGRLHRARAIRSRSPTLAWGVDLEAEVGVICDDVPMGASVAAAARRDPADRDPQRCELPQPHPGRAREGLRLPAGQGTDRVLARRRDAGRAGRTRGTARSCRCRCSRGSTARRSAGPMRAPT